MKYYGASWEDIEKGLISDVYFSRAVEVLKKEKKDRKVKMEIQAESLPQGWRWAVFCGLEEVVKLFENKNVNLWALPEGTAFGPGEPVLVVEGLYSEIGIFETAILGFLCHSSGVATKAARIKKAAGGKPVFSFGARRMHPAVAPAIDRAAYIGGCDGVAVVKAAQMLGLKPVGTMPHAMILLFGDTVEATRAFDKHIPEDVKRISLIDTFGDEKFETLRVAQELGERLFAVRLDTPSSRRGNMKRILEEIRWELDIRGFSHVRLFVSGGLDEEELLEINQIADAFGVGTSISNAPTVNFAMDIVEIEGKPLTKKGKRSAAKQIWRCPNLHKVQLPFDRKLEVCPICGQKAAPLLKLWIKEGKLTESLPSPADIKRRVEKETENLAL